jgi:hypothetical protein
MRVGIGGDVGLDETWRACAAQLLNAKTSASINNRDEFIVVSIDAEGFGLQGELSSVKFAPGKWEKRKGQMATSSNPTNPRNYSIITKSLDWGAL